MQNAAGPLCASNNMPLIDLPVATRIGGPGHLNIAPGRDHRNQKDIEGREIFPRDRAAGELSLGEHFSR